MPERRSRPEKPRAGAGPGPEGAEPPAAAGPGPGGTGGPDAREEEPVPRAPSRPVPVVPDLPGAPPAPDAAGRPQAPSPEARPPEAPPREAPAQLDAYPEDPFVAAAAAVLAASTFLPWYVSRGGVAASGWGTGTWGPVVFFLALGSLALVVMRRRGMAVGLPFEESLIHEGIGWVSLGATVLKTRMPPQPRELFGAGFGVWIALAAAVALALLAGRMSPHAPLVLRPGWHRGTAGRVGLLLIVAVVAGSGVFGATNSFRLEAAGPLGPIGKLPPGTVQGRLPKCAKGFPVPSGVTPGIGFEETGVQRCAATLQARRPLSELATLYRGALTRAGWKFKVTQETPFTTLELTGPRCGTLVIVGAGSNSAATLSLSPCGPTPSPG